MRGDVISVLVQLAIGFAIGTFFSNQMFLKIQEEELQKMIEFKKKQD